jgi:diguanylate cyclase (GGDEF)-like protein
VEDLHIQHSSSQISDYLTISLGVATIIPSRDQKPGTLINFADEALYQAKKTGRNKSVVYGQ